MYIEPKANHPAGARPTALRWRGLLFWLLVVGTVVALVVNIARVSEPRYVATAYLRVEAETPYVAYPQVHDWHQDATLTLVRTPLVLERVIAQPQSPSSISR